MSQLIRQLEAEIARLKRWVSDLQSGLYINCVYCGHRYGPNPGTPVTMAEVLRLHVESCPEHPMSKLKAEWKELVDENQLLRMRLNAALRRAK